MTHHVSVPHFAIWRLTASEAFWLGSAIVLSIAVHLLFLCNGFGEPDAARLANDAILWSRLGEIDSTTIDYRYRTSPLYLIWLRSLLAFGVEPARLPVIMSWGNLLLGSMGLLPIYLFARYLSSTATATVAVLFIAISPGFFIALNYGFPHLPGLVLFVVAALCMPSVISTQGKAKFTWVILSTFLLWLALSFKADLSLYLLAPVTMVWLYEGKNASAIVTILLIAVAAISGVLVLSKFLVPDPVSVVEFASQWEQQFPTLAGAFFASENITIIAGTAGLVFFILFFPAILYLYFRGNYQDKALLLVCLAGFLPATIFWGIRSMNSVRHNQGAWFFAVIIIAAALCLLLSYKRYRIALAAVAVIGLNYASGSTSPGASAINALSSRLIEQSLVWQQAAGQRHELANEFVELPVGDAEGKIAINAGLSAYIKFECLSRHPNAVLRDSGRMLIGSNNPMQSTARFGYAISQEAANRIAGNWGMRNWRIWSGEFDIDTSAYSATSPQESTMLSQRGCLP